jgi:TonB family protein
MNNLSRLPLLSAVLLFLIFVPESVIARAELSLPTQGIRIAAKDETAEGIKLYQQGQNEAAIKVLKDAAKRYNDVVAWHYLGLALEKKGKANDARKAHEKSAKLADKLFEAQLETVRNLGHLIEILTPIQSDLHFAGQSARKYIQLNPNLSGAKQEDWAARADLLLGLAEMANADPATKTVFLPKEVDVKAQILSKPKASYTEEARKRSVSGTVVLRSILTPTGRVISYPIKSLPAGLTAQALKASREIKFVPAMKDGKPVSMVVQVEYHFNIY